jgi:hypothetical protein
MAHILSCNLLTDLALSIKAHQILLELIMNGNQSQMLSESISIITTASHLFVYQQGLYRSAIVFQVLYNNFHSSINSSPETSGYGFIGVEHERPFIQIHPQLNSKESLLANVQKNGELLLAQLAKNNQEFDLAAWHIWIDDRGYLYFQPTHETLSMWLKMLFSHINADRNSDLLVDSGMTTTSNNSLHYIKLRCNQMQKLVSMPINPWAQGQLSCATIAELELIYGIIGVYDSLHMGAKYKIVAASKSLVERFLEFDRTCRLLDLPTNSPEFQERAGLIAIVRSAVEDLLASQNPESQPQF